MLKINEEQAVSLAYRFNSILINLEETGTSGICPGGNSDTSSVWHCKDCEKYFLSKGKVVEPRSTCPCNVLETDGLIKLVKDFLETF
jgi:hypothetical protein